MDKVLFESKAWEIIESEGMIFLVNKRFESEGRYEASTEVTADMVDTFEIKGVKVPKYIRAELSGIFAQIEEAAQEPVQEKEEAPETKFYVEAPELSIDEVREEIEEIKEGAGVWFLNGQIQTGKKFPYVWRDMELVGDEMKYSFVQGLDFDSKIVIYEMDEKAAWNKLLKILKERKEAVDIHERVEKPFEEEVEEMLQKREQELTVTDRQNTTLVMMPHAHFSLIIGKRYTVHYKDAHGEYELADMLYLGHGVQNDVLFFGDSFENILHVDPFKITALWTDILKQT